MADYSDIHKIAADLGLRNIKIRKDFEGDTVVDVQGDVDISHKNLDSIPIKFGRIFGQFNCNYNNLTSLENAPSIVDFGFSCSFNNLTDLQGGPGLVPDGDYYANFNKLKSIMGYPSNVRQTDTLLDVSNNEIETIDYFEECNMVIAAPHNLLWKYLINHNYSLQSVVKFINLHEDILSQALKEAPDQIKKGLKHILKVNNLPLNLTALDKI